MIRKLKSGKYRLYSRKNDPKTGKRRNLGTFGSLGGSEEARAGGAVLQAEGIVNALDAFRRMWDHAAWADELLLSELEAMHPPPALAWREYAHVLGAESVWLDRLLAAPAATCRVARALGRRGVVARRVAPRRVFGVRRGTLGRRARLYVSRT